MSADVLRKAAALMRERADLPYVKGQWEANGVYVRRTSDSPRMSHPAHAEGAICLRNDNDALVASEAVAEFIAAADPPFLLAVADWLDWVADGWSWNPEPTGNEGCAFAVAAAYLGSES